MREYIVLSDDDIHDLTNGKRTKELYNSIMECE